MMIEESFPETSPKTSPTTWKTGIFGFFYRPSLSILFCSFFTPSIITARLMNIRNISLYGITNYYLVLMLLIILRITYQILDPIVYDYTESTEFYFLNLGLFVLMSLTVVNHFNLRRKYRLLSGIQMLDTEAEDCLITICCEPCSLYQMSMEVDDDRAFSSTVFNFLTPPRLKEDLPVSLETDPKNTKNHAEVNL